MTPKYDIIFKLTSMDQELPHIYTVSALTRDIRDRLDFAGLS